MHEPDDIAKLISETIAPGKRGLIEEDQSEVEPGDMNVVKDMAIRVIEDAQKLIKAAEAGSIAQARSVLGDINGEVKQAFIHVNRLAQEHGLVEPEHRNDT